MMQESHRITISQRKGFAVAKSLLLYFFLVIAFLFTGETPSPSVSPELQRQLDELANRGITHRFLDANTIELYDPLSGTTRIKTLQEPSTSEIYSWASSKGIPILEIDPNTLDTNQWSGWYSWWTQVPLSNGVGRPLVVGDVDDNSHAEIYGVYCFHCFSDFRARIYEVDSGNGTAQFLHQYEPYPGVSRGVVDADRDSLREVVFTRGGILTDYEQPSQSALPTNIGFQYQRYETGVSPGSTGILLGLLDSDSSSDFLYEGTWRDSIDTTITRVGTAVAEFDYALNNFRRVWQRQEDPQYGRYGFSAGDFDGDGFMEFVQSSSTGWITVSENVGDNSYVQAWQENIPFANTLYHISGNVDYDSRQEFYVGATMSTGNWTIMFEADSNNHYSAKFIFHLLSGGTLDQPVYLTTDVDGDSALEIVIMSGRDLYIFEGNGDNDFRLWYLKREDSRDGVQFYDFNGDGLKDFVISKYAVDTLGRGIHYADVYKANPPVRVPEIELLPLRWTLGQNYPNPFNPITIIEYQIPFLQRVKLSVHNILGQEIVVLVDEVKPGGRHEIQWDGSIFPSGVYIYRLSTQMNSVSRKMLLLK